MNEDKARDLCKAHDWFSTGLRDSAQEIVRAHVNSVERLAAIGALIRLDKLAHCNWLEGERSDWRARAENANDKIAEIDAMLAALRGES